MVESHDRDCDGARSVCASATPYGREEGEGTRCSVLQGMRQGTRTAFFFMISFDSIPLASASFSNSRMSLQGGSAAALQGQLSDGSLRAGKRSLRKNRFENECRVVSTGERAAANISSVPSPVRRSTSLAAVTDSIV